jgi:hypothetical protein
MDPDYHYGIKNIKIKKSQAVRISYFLAIER